MVRTREDLFNEKSPDVSEQEIVEAARDKRIVVAFGSHTMIVRRPRIDSMAVKFVLENGSSTVLLLDQHVCEVFRLMAEALNAAKWRATQLSPPGQKPH